MGRSLIVHLFAFCTCMALDPPPINLIEQGTIVGKEVSMVRTQRIWAYLGIPYAKPPLETLRFAPPAPPEPWDGVRNATDYAPACYQVENDLNPRDYPFLKIISDLSYVTDEDCLYLNVFVPYGQPPPGGFSVMVWFHPGNFTTGNPAIWNPYTLVYRQRVIVVTFAYRLGVLGFLSTLDGEAPGNFGMMDQQAALGWIKRNVELFGGNSSNICLFGYGTGALSIGLHTVSPQSRDLFAKAIIMSSDFLNPLAIKTQEEDAGLLDRMAKDFTCFRRPTSDLISCLRRAPVQSLVGYTTDINWRPLLDNDLSNGTLPFLPQLPRNYFESDDVYKIPILTGYTNMEEVLSVAGLDAEQPSPDEVDEEFVPGLLEQIVGRDFAPAFANDTCASNKDIIMDTVRFFYGPRTPVRDPDRARRWVIDFATEKIYGSSTYLHASFVSKYNPTYVYRFDMKPNSAGATAQIPDWVSVPHLFDLIYVWGVPYWAPLPNEEWDGRDKKMSDIIMSLWASFAKFSDPTENSIYHIKWDPFTKGESGILIIDRTFNMSDTLTLNPKVFDFWNDYYPKIVTIGSQCCNVTDAAADTQYFNMRGKYFVFLVSVISFIKYSLL